ncbi:ABC transporter, ATP-binding protein [Oceanicola granulosus HTCC2516]|uniref:ABC transporter, ATP-binding protein n=1 Tax=Oceanicola granulosus (strain ATCC BAA-861 / DSM 15982 / KCTC 12143 / HTCC2516) TaxID=314256 RepID=Q2CHA6_OCEGH|nr:sn-glycerol-3-phosphate ABC transporter ATP-binding protein UgpC [Oceanicola granulosus]EAR52133.1 ABC transporter, ATP-binding protein [Oceanicola granulosus HTCC2516]
MASVDIENVSKAYAGMQVMHGVDAAIADGEFVVLVGPSGCGKSTLLRMIAGLEEITGGTIRIGDKVVNGTPPKERNVSMVFQNYALYPHMTVAENMAFSLTLAGAPKAEKDDKVRRAAEILDITPLLDRKPRALSGGQRQRVAMGRSIVRNPAVFLFDEPLSNLDAKLRVQMRSEIKALHRRLGTTMIYVTHDQVEAMTMADRIVVLQAGRIEQVGAPLELYDRPANAFVAEFIGSPSMNLIPARASGGQLQIDGGGAAALPAAAAVPDGARVRIGKRPEEIRPAAGGLPARVENIDPTGSESVVDLTMAGRPLTMVLRERPTFDVGDEIAVTFDNGATHFFDEASGRRLERGSVDGQSSRMAEGDLE